MQVAAVADRFATCVPVYCKFLDCFSGNNAAFGIGAFITPWVIALINSLFRNKMIFKKIFDEKFYYFFLGVLIFGFISTTIGSFSS